MAQQTLRLDRRMDHPLMSFVASIWDGRNRSLLVAFILALSLFAFEIFNFDTTKFALRDLLGDTNFAGITWAAILAFAFCAIDFAGLVKIFTPQQGMNEPKEVWYLMGAWLLGATMNAVMTWYAVSVLLVSRPLGTDVLSRETLLTFVPIFVAVLVWLTRILFIGSLSVAGEQLLAASRQSRQQAKVGRYPSAARPAKPNGRPVYQPENVFEDEVDEPPEPSPASRVRRRPPTPGINPRHSTVPLRARGR